MTHSYLPFRNRPSGKEFWASLDLRTTKITYTLPNNGRRVTALVRMEALIYPNGSVKAQLFPLLAVGWAKTNLEEVDFDRFGQFLRKMVEDTDIYALREHGFDETFLAQCGKNHVSYHCIEVNYFVVLRMPFFVLFGSLPDE